MYVRRLSLTNFRCYRQLDLTLPCGTVVISGGNAQGKTSLLEALYVLATTRSPHAVNDRELVHWDAAADVMPFGRVWGEIARSDGTETIEVLNVAQSADGGEERYAKRTRVNNAPRRAFEVIGHLNVVLFSPRDLQIVDGAPTQRRRYLDVLLCQVDRAYCRALSAYNRVMTQRNHLLRRLRDRGGDREELRYWNDRLVEQGAHLVARRRSTVAALNDLARDLHDELVGGGEALAIDYRSEVAQVMAESRQPTVEGLAAGGVDDAVPADQAEVRATFDRLLTERRGEEIARGATIVGPHRDDLCFSVGGVNMRNYGSRGQQRTVTLALKLAEAQFMWRVTGERPVLLLDDVLSELDSDRRRHVLTHVDSHQQTLITTTEADSLPAEFRALALVLHLDAARIVGAHRGGQAVTPPVDPHVAPG